ncbi:MAG: YggS family pyridoxal phosphate-dependent enzyme, partial [Victivallales bacterium]|nr:YggS family pyridoxal phosphate-dependent enzyme [Victivallales bacterium]
MSALIDNLNAVRAQISAAAAAAGRNPEDVFLLAVSKTFPAADIAEAYRDGGQRAFGENWVQELEEKAPQLPEDIQWHLIGHLQRNEVRSAVKYASWIHSVDSPALLHRIQAIAAETGKSPKVLLEVNISGEESKFGFTAEAAAETLTSLKGEMAAPVVGFMTMA